MPWRPAVRLAFLPRGGEVRRLARPAGGRHHGEHLSRAVAMQHMGRGVVHINTRDHPHLLARPGVHVVLIGLHRLQPADLAARGGVCGRPIAAGKGILIAIHLVVIGAGGRADCAQRPGVGVAAIGVARGVRCWASSRPFWRHWRQPRGLVLAEVGQRDEWRRAALTLPLAPHGTRALISPPAHMPVCAAAQMAPPARPPRDGCISHVRRSRCPRI
mmetsp:Transcript_33307/g.96194  ORF Transcript_33307/g.96194 Transcript_33307/m.96194 type:complete len:216 (-) Transcript_33307:504-1151(-)